MLEIFHYIQSYRICMKKLKPWVKIIAVLCLVCALFFLPFLFKTSPSVTSEASEQKEYVTDAKCEVSIKVAGSEIPLELEEYVIGVVAAEMPANFQLEALKAQAIAARTYVLKTTNYGEKEIEPTVARQVFYDAETRKENWDKSFEEYESKVREAVESTAGEIITYNNELITAMFHSMSTGMTESSKNYSGNDIPYLQPVASADYQHAPNYESSKKFTIAEWNKLLNVNWTIKNINQLKIERNNTGRVETVSMGKQQWTGRDLRTLLDLRSTDFRIEVKGDQIVVTTEGYGHGVGMSQYGADAMAENGATAHKILQHYYKDTKIEKINCKN